VYRVSTFTTDTAEGPGVDLVKASARTMAAALRGAWELLGGIPECEALIRRDSEDGLVGYLRTDYRGQLAEAEVYARRRGGPCWTVAGCTVVTELNPDGPLFRKPQWERVVFLQGEEADEALAVLDERGEEAALSYLADWHYPGEHETADEPGAGSSDDVYDDGTGYRLTYNRGLGYIGLEWRTFDGGR
jgi:hypothetical protein